MPRQTHGRYDDQHGLPDNSGQAVGSGTDVWLQEQIIELIGNEAAQLLIEKARRYGVQRYKWLCDRLSEHGHEKLAEK